MKSSSTLTPLSTGSRLSAICLGIYALLSSLASAHPGHPHPGEEDEFDSFAHGFVHPFTGLDHLLLALAAGWLAFAFARGKVSLPFGAFLSALAAGALVGKGLHGGTGLEIALSLTVIAAGAAIAVGRTPGLGPFAAAIALGGFIHGFAHGAEASPGSPFAIYALGFITGTAALLAIGGLLQRAAPALRKPMLPKVAGGALIALGSIALIQAL